MRGLLCCSRGEPLDREIKQTAPSSAYPPNEPPPQPPELGLALTAPSKVEPMDVVIGMEEPERADSPPLYKPPAPVITAAPSSDLRSSTGPSSPATPGTPSSPGLTLIHGGDGLFTLPVSLERTIKVKKANDQLGVTVDAVDKAVNGCVVKTISPSGAVGKDGRLQVGDYVISVNNETMRHITNAQARAILRRASLLGTDISITYITAGDATMHHNSSSVIVRDQGSPPVASQLSPNSKLRQPGSPSPGDSSPQSTEGGRSAPLATPPTLQTAPLSSSPTATCSSSTATMVTTTSSTTQVITRATIMSTTTSSISPQPSPPTLSQKQQAAARQLSVASSWGPSRYVQIHRQQGENLGISIVGGRVDLFNVNSDSQKAISGIFIKQVLEQSPAGRNGQLSKGDRILEVDGVDLREATHDKAVEVIRKATSPVNFVVQSLLDPEWSTSEPENPTRLSPLPTEEDATQPALISGVEVIIAPDEEATLKSAPSPPMQSPEASSKTGASSPVTTTTNVMSISPITTQPPPVQEDSDSDSSEEDSEDDEEEDEFGYTMKKLLTSYGELNGQLHMVDIERTNNGLGLSLAGNRDLDTMSIFVVGIHPNSPVAKDGRIHIGDQLLEINGQVLYGRSHLNASAIIKSVTSRKVKIILLRRDENLKLMAVKPLKLPKVLPKDDPATVIPMSLKSENSLDMDDEDDKINSSTSVEERTSSPPTGNHVHNAASSPSQLDFSKFHNVNTINLTKGQQGLGFSIEEGSHNNTSAIYVKSITPGGPADEEGQLCVGDHVLAIQRESLIGASYNEAIEVLRQAARGPVQLTTSRRSGDMKEAGPQVASDSVANSIMDDSAKTQESSVDETPQTAPPVSALPTTPIVIVEEEEPEDPATCPITPGREVTIQIQKGKTGLGLSIVGGADTLLGAIIVHEVYEDGAAAKDGRLWAGDQVIEVNHEDLREASHDRAIQVLRQTPPVVHMVIFRDESLLKEDEMYDVFTVEMMKKPNKGLGLSIVGRRKDLGVFISDIVKGGVAEADGRLMQGDQILSVNKEDVRHYTQENAAALLKTLMGKVVLTIGRLKATSRSSSRRSSSQSGGYSDRGLKKSDSNVSNKQARGKHAKMSTSSQEGESNNVLLVSYTKTEDDDFAGLPSSKSY